MQANLLYQCKDFIGEAATWLPKSGKFVWLDINNAAASPKMMQRGVEKIKRLRLKNQTPALKKSDACGAFIRQRSRINSAVLPNKYATCADFFQKHACEDFVLHEYNPETGGVTNHGFMDCITAIIPQKNDDNEVWLTMRNRLISYNLQTKMQKELTTIFPYDLNFRTNDARLSPDGRIWVGVMHNKNHNETGALYCIDPDFSSRQVLKNQCIPNGMAWNAAGNLMYYADSGRGCIYRFIYNKDKGLIHSPQIAVHVPPEFGVPDGMTIDEQGRLWVAHWGGFGVYVWNPESGRLIDKVQVDAPLVASCAIGGRNRNELYITTARSGLTDDEMQKFPLSGSLFHTII